ncbi:MAG TPA: hypothetical protein VF335_05675, partial [Chitinivibrionales bacterium]
PNKNEHEHEEKKVYAPHDSDKVHTGLFKKKVCGYKSGHNLCILKYMFYGLILSRLQLKYIVCRFCTPGYDAS